MKTNPAQHVDVGSTYQLSGFLSRIVPTVFSDIRPIETELDNLVTKKGNILDIPYPDNSIESLSCLHVIEHVGLGRYGDAIDPEGTMKACKELSRVLKKNGLLYLSLPVGKERICFNAHRVCSPKNVTKYLENLKLLEFSVVDDTGKFIRSCDYREYEHADYSCGLFLFTK
jgi:ubiquinone/menaquinone biosynthesis C-methylase UbiE